jgi:hypothetical protein
MSAVPLIPARKQTSLKVGVGPVPDSCTAAKSYSITSSARTSSEARYRSEGPTSTPIAHGTGLRSKLRPEGARRPLLLFDSASLVDPNEDQDAVIVTGSHDDLVGGDPQMAPGVDGFAAPLNDAGIGIDRGGLGWLAPLGARGIAVITVAAATARIGEARSTFAGRI